MLATIPIWKFNLQIVQTLICLRERGQIDDPKALSKKDTRADEGLSHCCHHWAPTVR